MLYKTMIWVGDGVDETLNQLSQDGWTVHSMLSHGFLEVESDSIKTSSPVTQYLFYRLPEVAPSYERQPIGMPMITKVKAPK